MKRICALICAALCLLQLASIVTSSSYEDCLNIPKLTIRQHDGTCNNLMNPSWGASEEVLDFSVEGLQNPQPANLPNERTLSNELFAEVPSKLPGHFTTEERRLGVTPDPLGRNMFFAIYGQFLGHGMLY